MNDIYTKKSIGLIHKIYFIQLKNKKNYTASTKTKSEVSGGGRKPWRQKGTGQARAGSSRSPLWVGGGVSFGPQPHIVSKKANKKEKRLAIYLAFKLKKNFTRLVDEKSLFFEKPSTKKLANFLKEFHFPKDKNILLLLSDKSKMLVLSSLNIPHVSVSEIKNLGLAQLLKADFILISRTALNIIEENHGILDK